MKELNLTEKQELGRDHREGQGEIVKELSLTENQELEYASNSCGPRPNDIVLKALGIK